MCRNVFTKLTIFAVTIAGATGMLIAGRSVAANTTAFRTARSPRTTRSRCANPQPQPVPDSTTPAPEPKPGDTKPDEAKPTPKPDETKPEPKPDDPSRPPNRIGPPLSRNRPSRNKSSKSSRASWCG